MHVRVSSFIKHASSRSATGRRCGLAAGAVLGANGRARARGGGGAELVRDGPALAREDGRAGDPKRGGLYARGACAVGAFGEAFGLMTA